MSVTGITKDPGIFAAANGLEIVEPNPRELQLDIDSPTLPANWEEQIYILGQSNRIVSERRTISKSGNLHVYLTLENDFSNIERVLFQCCLGSDPKRELFTYQNYCNSENKRPQFLFEVKKANAD